MLSRAEDGAFDGIKETRQTKACREVMVDLTTVDHEWSKLGKPEVSLIKCDVEGAELFVLEGAEECIRTWNPFIVLEITPENYTGYEYGAEEIMHWCNRMKMRLFRLPELIAIASSTELNLHFLRTNSFLLAAEARSAVAKRVV
jgi:hypothetical protein